MIVNQTMKGINADSYLDKREERATETGQYTNY